MKMQKAWHVRGFGLVSLVGVMLLGLFLPLNGVWGAVEERVTPEVEKALLAEDWTRVADLLKEVTPQSPSAVLRLLKGHACLALNRNNEALCLFLSLDTEEERQEWHKWASTFAQGHATAPIAAYFQGDALARLGRLEEAQTSFTRGLELQREHPLLLNARGVVLALRQNWQEAKADLTKAGENPRFPLADAYINLGGMFIHRKDGAQGALRAFDRALQLSPDSCLALLGRGCVELVLNQSPEAVKDLKRAQSLAGCARPLVDDTFLDIFERQTGVEKAYILALRQEGKAGTFYDVRFEDVKKSYEAWKANPTDQKLYNRFHTQAALLPPKYQKPILLMMKNDAAGDPNLALQMKKCESRIYSHNLDPNTKHMGELVKDLGHDMGRIMRAHGAVKSGAGIAKASQVWAQKIDNTTKANLKFSIKVFTDALSGSGGSVPRLGDISRAPGGQRENISPNSLGAAGQRGSGGLEGRGRTLGVPSAYSARTRADNCVGGVDVSFQQAVWDVGDWPFKAHFGLLY